MKRVPTVFTVAPPQHPHPSRVVAIRMLNDRKARREYVRRVFLRRCA